MIGIDVLASQLSGLQRQDLERWIFNQWVRPDNQAGDYVFSDIDVARVQLILELRDQLDIDEDTLPVVLSLLDQVYDLRRRLRELGDALTRIASDQVRQDLAAHLARQEW